MLSFWEGRTKSSFCHFLATKERRGLVGLGIVVFTILSIFFTPTSLSICFYDSLAFFIFFIRSAPLFLPFNVGTFLILHQSIHVFI